MTQIEKITKELKARGISQKEFCDSLNIGESTFSTWKLRNSRIPSKHIVSVSNFFEWPVEELLKCEEEIQISESNSNQINNNMTNSNNISSKMVINQSTGLESEFLESFNKLSFSDKSKVIALVAELSEGENNEG